MPQLGWSGPPTRTVGDAEFRAGLSLAERVLPLLADYPEAITIDPEAAGLDFFDRIREVRDTFNLPTADQPVFVRFPRPAVMSEHRSGAHMRT